MIPYMFFLLISYCYWLIANRFSPVQVDCYDIVKAFVIGSNYQNEFFFNAPMWFFPALISTHIIAVMFNKFTATQGILGALITSASAMLAFTFLKLRLPWGIDVALTMIFFFSLGKAIRNQLPKIIPLALDSGIKRYASIIVTFLLLIFLSEVNGRVDVNTLMFANIPLFFINALLGILLTILISFSVNQNKTFTYLSKNTLWFFPLHVFAFALLTFLLTRIGGIDIALKDKSFIFSVIYTTFAFLIISLVINIKNRVGFKWF